MTQLDLPAKQWLEQILRVPFTASRHRYSHQDEVYRIEAPRRTYYLKVSPSLTAERDNLQKLESVLLVPKVIAFHRAADKDHLLISELPGKNLVELIGAWSDRHIVETFAKAVRQLHQVNVTKVFPEAGAADVLLHGDIALPNIIISTPDKPTGFIDFGQLSFGPRELDLVDAIWSLQRNLGPRYGELFLEEYGPVAITSKIEGALSFRYKPS